MLFCQRIHYIWMINALLLQNLVVEIYALFPPIFLGWQIVSANIFAFWMYAKLFLFTNLNWKLSEEKIRNWNPIAAVSTKALETKMTGRSLQTVANPIALTESGKGVRWQWIVVNLASNRGWWRGYRRSFSGAESPQTSQVMYPLPHLQDINQHNLPIDQHGDTLILIMTYHL